MNRLKRILILFAVAGLSLLPAQARAAESDMDRSSSSAASMTSMAISDIMEEDAKNNLGETLGTVDDLVIGPDGRVQYLVVARDEGILKEERLFAIPWDMVNVGEEADVSVNIDTEKLTKAPNFARNEWPDFDDPSVKSQYSSYFTAQQSSDKIS